MLWLLGLMGVAVVGTAFVGESTETADDTDRPDPFDNLNPDLPTVSPAAFLDPSDGNDTAVGSAGPDTLDGGSGDDQIGGYAGDDLMSGGPGDDGLHGMDGDDNLTGDDDADSLYGEDGADTLTGGAGNDVLYGGNDNDLLAGGAGDDALQGGAGNDDLRGGAGDDALSGGLDGDTLSGGAGADTLMGGADNDVLNGLLSEYNSAVTEDDGAVDFLNGGIGNDLIIAGEGDIVTTGDGADTVVAASWENVDAAVEVMDLDPAQDDLVLFYEEDGGPAPEITVEADPDDAEARQVLLDGIVVAQVRGAPHLTVDDISLVPSDPDAFVFNATTGT